MRPLPVPMSLLDVYGIWWSLLLQKHTEEPMVYVISDPDKGRFPERVLRVCC